MKKKVIANNILQTNYVYYITEPAGRNFDPEFKPDLSPKEMLQLGVFGGHYFLDENSRSELPKSWWQGVALSHTGKKEKEYNYFKIRASQPFEVWQKKGWIHPQDPHGWFQWYCRYYLGRRSDDDARQISRWKAFRRHLSQVAQNCRPGDIHCRPKQRQALLHWAYDSRKI